MPRSDETLIIRLWSESNGFKKFWRSYFFMITHPKQCLRMLSFAIKVLASYGIWKTDEIMEE